MDAPGSQGDIHTRVSPIGNPKHEYLPQHQQQMEAELHGMIARWHNAGRPLADVYHPMSLWAKTVGGILQVAGYKDFLGNYGQAARQIDPQRRAVAILGAACPGKPMRPAEWAHWQEQGLAESLFSTADRDTPAGRQQGIGVVFRRYLNVPLEAETETKRLRPLKLTKAYKRWDSGENGYYKYTFAVVEELPLDEAATKAPIEESVAEPLLMNDSYSSRAATTRIPDPEPPFSHSDDN